MSIFRDGLFAGQTAFFTGGTSGIGLAIAERFAALGARTALFSRKQEKVDAAVQAIAARGGEARGFTGDVRNYADVEAALGQTREAWGEIDFLFCIAAGNFPAPATGMSANGFKAVIDIDVLGTFNTCRAAHEHLRKPGASVISISANQAQVAYPYQSHVCAAKAGVELLSKTLALEWGPQGIRVNCITPGPIDETEGMARLAPTAAARAAVTNAVPLRRMGRKEDIANVAVFLCSDAAAYVTGSIYHCDGGTGLIGARLLDLNG
ncbi:MAG: SDR family oxidoreductase [Bryobacterales bacterium]|nr:SDR family oxidoreductase [Bryobacterales bacterium]